MKKKADLMSMTGLILGFGLMVVGIILTKNLDTQQYVINTGNLMSFFDPTSIAIVFGGTFAGLMIMFPGSQFAKIPKHMKIIFMPKQYVPQAYINRLTECAKKARINGLLALEEDANEMEDSFMKNGIQMIVDSVDPEKVKIEMESWLDNMDERHTLERSFYDKGASLAPAFGMVGTLIGLINMLKSLEDISTVGPNMAVALITTLYGSILANLFFAPVANKLRVRHEEEYLCMRIVCEGIQSIQAGENPKIIQDKLLHMLPEYQQKKFSDTGESPAEGDGKKTKEKKAKK